MAHPNNIRIVAGRNFAEIAQSMSKFLQSRKEIAAAASPAALWATLLPPRLQKRLMTTN